MGRHATNLRTTSHTTAATVAAAAATAAVAVAASVEECERDRRGWPTRQNFSSVEILHALLNNLCAVSCSDECCRLFDGVPTNCCIAHVFLAWLRRMRLCYPIHPMRGKIIKSRQCFTVSISLVLDPALIDGFVSMFLGFSDCLMR